MNENDVIYPDPLSLILSHEESRSQTIGDPQVQNRRKDIWDT